MANRVKDKPTAASPGGDDWLLIDSLLNGGRKLAPTYFERALGNPAADGYILSSTAAGVRSWIVAPSGGGGGGGGGSWGSIIGTLSAQSDLVAELAAAKARANHTGTQSADTLTDGVTNKAYLEVERTKLAGIATGATANSADATLLARANHTGTQAQSTVTNLVSDLAAKMALAGAETVTGQKTFNLSPNIPRTDLGTNLANGTALTVNTHYKGTLSSAKSLTLSGVFVNGSSTSLMLNVTTQAVLTLPVVTIRRVGDSNTAVTALTLPVGRHMLTLIYDNAEYILIDSVGLVNKFDATAAPAVGNDGTQGYTVGSLWIDVTNDHPYICVDSSTGAAVWKQTDAAGGGSGDVVGQASSVDSEVALFSGTGGKTIKRGTGSGLAKLTSGVLSVAVASTDYCTPTGTENLQNKRIDARITTITSNATPTINTDICDAVTITALAAAITSMTTNLTGTPKNFDMLMIRIKDNGTARAITWGASFEAKGAALPTTTVLSKVLHVLFIYDTVTSKWGCISTAQEA